MAACSAAADTKWSRESWDRKGVGANGERGKVGRNGDSKDSNTETEKGVGGGEERQCIEK